MSANGPIQLTIVTPEKPVVQDRVEELEIPGANGYFGVLPGHAPLFSKLRVGIIGYRRGSQWTRVAVTGGFAEVLPDQVRILAENADRAEDIDLEKARKAQQSAEQTIAHGGDDLNYDDAMNSLEEANVRIQVATNTVN